MRCCMMLPLNWYPSTDIGRKCHFMTLHMFSTWKLRKMAKLHTDSYGMNVNSVKTLLIKRHSVQSEITRILDCSGIWYPPECSITCMKLMAVKWIPLIPLDQLALPKCVINTFWKNTLALSGYKMSTFGQQRSIPMPEARTSHKRVTFR